MSKSKWWHQKIGDNEWTTNCYASREEAIEAGRSAYPGRPFEVQRGTMPDAASVMLNAADILEQIRDAAPFGSDEPYQCSIAAERELTEWLEAWATKNLKVQYYEADGEPEVIEPLVQFTVPTTPVESGVYHNHAKPCGTVGCKGSIVMTDESFFRAWHIVTNGSK